MTANKTRPEPSFSVAQVEAALCIWEWMNDARSDHSEWAASPAATVPWRDGLLRLWEAVGTGQMRMLAWELAPGVETLYQALCADLGEDELRDVFCAYDWEFIPAVCIALDWSEGGQMQRACYQIGPVELPEAVRAAVLAEYQEGKARLEAGRAEAAKRAADLETYTAKCRRAAGRMFGYPDLVGDDPQSVRNSFEREETPEQWAEYAGRHCDDLDPMTAADMASIYAEPVTP